MQARAYVPAELQARLLAATSPELELSFRPMFGGIMGYARGRPFASLSDVGLAFKLAGADHVALLALPGARPLRYEPDSPPSQSYVWCRTRSWTTRPSSPPGPNAAPATWPPGPRSAPEGGLRERPKAADPVSSVRSVSRHGRRPPASAASEGPCFIPI